MSPKKNEEEQSEDDTQSELTLEQRVKNIETWLKWLLRASGITLVGLLVFAFWLGTISSKVSTSSETINRVYGSVSEGSDSLQVRTGKIETRLSSIDANLTTMNASLNTMNGHLTRLLREETNVVVKPLPLPSPTP